MGIAEIVIAIATTITAIAGILTAIYTLKRNRRENMPFVKATVIKRHAEYVLVHLQFFPARFPVSINKISTNAIGLAPCNDEEMRNVKGTRHDESVSVQLDLPPVGVSLMPPSLTFSIKLRSDQKSLDIFLYKSMVRSWDLHKKYKVTIKAVA